MRTLPTPAGLVVRPIRPHDANALRAFHSRLSPETVQRRFFGAHPQLSDKEVRSFTWLEPRTQAALVATVDGELVGVGRYNRLGDGICAEAAFVVEDHYQGRGIGTELLAGLARIAWGEGIRRFVADTLVGNRSMLDVFHHTGRALTVESSSMDTGVIHLLMPLTPPMLPALAPQALPEATPRHLQGPADPAGDGTTASVSGHRARACSEEDHRRFTFHLL